MSSGIYLHLTCSGLLIESLFLLNLPGDGLSSDSVIRRDKTLYHFPQHSAISSHRPDSFLVFVESKSADERCNGVSGAPI